MSDVDLDFEPSAEASGSDTFPVRAGTLRRNGHVLMDGFPCRLTDVSISKSGQHGRTEVNLTGIDVFTGDRHEDMHPCAHDVEVPVVVHTEYVLAGIDDGYLSLLVGSSGETRDGVALPEGVLGRAIESDFAAGRDVRVAVTRAMGREAVTGHRAE
ncbi:translation initiation factor IF-5A [Streptomyces sp. A0592]|uniref:translation initiation factor IF-5A n=1 Tax=Streptomyces sp. A0592 TaxID=2563099 RepID=UPI00109EAE05|nr:translation initiation factor IF-5A [Streptomyces sp. A0592]THA75722.1 translation initiation factor IF-5A [Streptomyces sp. A0592]